MNTEMYVSWNEGAEILGVKRSAFFYLVENGRIRKEDGRSVRDGRYSKADIEALKERRKHGTRPRHYRRRPVPVELDWLRASDIPAILRLDQLVFDEIDLASAQRYMEWSIKNPQLAMCAFDIKSNRQTMLAYVAALPLEESVILQIMRGQREETSITMDEIQTYERTGGYTLLANSAVCLPEHPTLLFQVIHRMIAEWVERFPDRYVTRIYAQSWSERGDMLIQHFFMAPRYDLARNAFMLDLARPGTSKLIQRFQSQLMLKASLPAELQPDYTPELVYAQKPRVHMVAERSAPAPAQSGLPGGLVSWRSFSNLHGISEGTAKKAISSGRLSIVEGEWRVGKALIKGALDAQGRSRFYGLYNTNPHWKDCTDCPHG